MAYVPGFRYDVFISYAVADNIRPAEDEPGRVDVIERQLRLELSIEVKRKREVLLWRDTKRLSCGDNFTDEISQGVSDSAVMVVLLSNQYMASDWCRQERETFLGTLEAQANRAKRLFIVQLTDPKRFERVPDGWNEIHHCRLWREDGGIPRRLGHPVPDGKKPEHQGCFDRVHDVVQVSRWRGGWGPVPRGGRLIACGRDMGHSAADRGGLRGSFRPAPAADVFPGDPAHGTPFPEF